MLRPKNRRRATQTAALALSLLLLVAAPTAAGIRLSTAAPPPSLLVKLDPSLPGPPLPPGTRLLGRTLTGVDVVELPRGAKVGAWISRFARLPGVVYAEPNGQARGAATPPNDPRFGSQWAWGVLRAVDGWAAYPGGYVPTGGATIGIVDSGIDSTHPDLAGRVLTGAGASCVGPGGTCIAGAALDDNGHGTHVAGVAGAATNNGVGVAGTAFDAQLIPVKVLDASNTGSYAAITNGIVWAAQHGASVINLSIVGSVPSKTLCDAVAQARAGGAVVVAAAGNAGNSAPSYPAACAGAIGVAATDSSDAPASFSNYGNPDVFVSAPGVSILSTLVGGSYGTMSGTSMATAFVSGLASQLLGQLPSRNPAGVAAVLATTSDKVGSASYGSDPYGTCTGCTWTSSYGYGRIDLAGALGAADFALAASPPTESVTQGGSAIFQVAVQTVNGFAGSVSLAVQGLPLGWTASFAPQTVAAPGFSTLTLSTSPISPPGTYVLTIVGTSGTTVRATQVTVTLTPLISVGGGPPSLPSLPPLPVPVPLPTPPVAPATPVDFSVAIVPSVERSLLGAPVAYAVTLVGSTPGIAAVDLSVSGLPPGVAAVLAPSSTTVPGAATLTIAPTPTTPKGAYTFTVTATGGGLTRSASAVLRVG